MKSAIIRSSWIPGYSYRLDCQPYLGGALETKVLLEALPMRKEPLRSLTAGFNGGIYNGPQFTRNYLDSPQHGVPFLTGSTMQLADLSNLPLLSKRDAYAPKLRHLELEPGMSLISCSGTIGKMAYARREMTGVWSSQDILKVVADQEKIDSGYLYAYLTSKFGIPLVASGTYGAIIQHLEPEHIADLPVPRLDRTLERQIHELIEEAAELRSSASTLIADCTASLQEFLQLPVLKNADVRASGIAHVSSSALNMRLDATYHSNAATEADEAICQSTAPVRRLADVTRRLFKPPMFKRIWVDEPAMGRQFVSGNDAYRIRADEKRYVSRSTPDHDDFVVKEGWVIFQAAGQIYGLFGRPLLVYGWLSELFIADDMYRIVPNEPTDGGYLFAFFRTKVGEVLIKRQSAGNSIPRVWDPQMTQVKIPWPEREQRQLFGTQILTAHEMRSRATKNEERAMQILEQQFEQCS